MKSIIPIKENRKCYASPEQREVLIDLLKYKIVNENFFLTGGTALAVFYLNHRLSNDLDLFTLQNVDLPEVDFAIRTTWKNECVKIKESPNFLSLLIKNTKVDFVIDPLSFQETREKFFFETNQFILIDTINNIASNKLCTIVSRVEPKDFIDFYFIYKFLNITSIENIYNDALKKDAIFDDPPTAAYQIEEGIQFLKRNPEIFPELLMNFKQDNFYDFYFKITQWIYKKIE